MTDNDNRKSQKSMASLQKWKMIAFVGMLCIIPVVA